MLKILNQIAPFNLAESWDNSGLLIGNISDNFSKIILSLDIDDFVINSSPKNSLIITHHPLIFKENLNLHQFPQNYIKKMILKKQKLISLHTNFDKAILNKFVFENILGFKIIENNDFLIIGKVNFLRKDFLRFIKKKLNLKFLKYTTLPKKIKNIAFTTGSGMSLIHNVTKKNNIDVFLTGDIKYHNSMESNALNIGLIDIGHYESEIFFSQILYKYLEKFKIQGIILDSKNPFKYFK